MTSEYFENIIKSIISREKKNMLNWKLSDLFCDKKKYSKSFTQCKNSLEEKLFTAEYTRLCYISNRIMILQSIEFASCEERTF